MSAKVVSLRGKPVPPPGTPNPEVVDELEEWLARANAGQVQGIAIAALYCDGCTGGRWGGVLSRSMVGQLFSLMQRITASLNE
jgi:hypothetical protein